MSAAAPIAVFARRSIKGARRRDLARQLMNADGTPGNHGIAFFSGGVDVYFSTSDGFAHVFLPTHIVDQIKAGPITTHPVYGAPAVAS